MEFTGTIHKICETVHIKETFKKRDVIIEASETKGDRTFTELVTFQFIQDKCDLLDGVKVGDQINIGFNLKGRKWVSPQGEEKFFNTLQAWMINILKEDLPTPQAEIPQDAPVPPVMGNDSLEDTPF